MSHMKEKWVASKSCVARHERIAESNSGQMAKEVGGHSVRNVSLPRTASVFLTWNDVKLASLDMVSGMQ
jgi:hypothetical protein